MLYSISLRWSQQRPDALTHVSHGQLQVVMLRPYNLRSERLRKILSSFASSSKDTLRHDTKKGS